MLAVLWTVAVVTSGWMDLPRARHMPHDSQFENRLSGRALAILRGPDTVVREQTSPPVDDTLVWSEDPRIVRMANGMHLAFPSGTTDAQAEVVAAEYHQLLIAEADRQTAPYLLQWLAIWLAPLLVGGLAAWLVQRERGQRGERSMPPGGEMQSLS